MALASAAASDFKMGANAITACNATVLGARTEDRATVANPGSLLLGLVASQAYAGPRLSSKFQRESASNGLPAVGNLASPIAPEYIVHEYCYWLGSS